MKRLKNILGKTKIVLGKQSHRDLILANHIMQFSIMGYKSRDSFQFFRTYEEFTSYVLLGNIRECVMVFPISDKTEQPFFHRITLLSCNNASASKLDQYEHVFFGSVPNLVMIVAPNLFIYNIAHCSITSSTIIPHFAEKSNTSQKTGKKKLFLL
jgi:hypothetical protein